MSPEPPSGRALLLDRLRGQLGPAFVDEEADPPYIRCRPGSAAQVAAALAAARVGGVRASCTFAREALLHLDLSRLDHVAVDSTALLCTAGAGISLGRLQSALRAHGLSLGPLPPRSLSRTLGAALAAPRPSEASPSLGRLRDRPRQLQAVLPGHGEMDLPVRPAPRRSAGPDLKQLLIGSQGKVGILVSATLPLVRPGPERRLMGWMLPTVEAAARALWEVLHGLAGVGPMDLHLVEPGLLRAAASGAELPPGDAALLVRAEGPAALVEAQQALARARCADGMALPEALCAAWLDPDEHVAPALWPAAERALPAPSAAELAAVMRACCGPWVLCGVHLHGAALCAADLPGGAASATATRLYDELRAALDPQRLLC